MLSDLLNESLSFINDEVTTIKHDSFLRDEFSIRNGFSKLDNFANLLAFGVGAPAMTIAAGGLAISMLPILAIVGCCSFTCLRNCETGKGLFAIAGMVLWVGLCLILLALIMPAVFKIAGYALAGALGTAVAAFALWASLRLVTGLVGGCLFVANKGIEKISDTVSKIGLYNNKGSSENNNDNRKKYEPL